MHNCAKLDCFVSSNFLGSKEYITMMHLLSVVKSRVGLFNIDFRC